MNSGFRLGHIAGVEIGVDWSLLIIFFLITFSLGMGVFPSWHPEWSAAVAWSTAVAAALLFFASVLAHELSHALVGRAMGVPINRITLFVFGGMAQMDGEPPTWRAELAMAIVGPLTSLVLGFGFLWLASTIAGPIELNPDAPGETLAGLGVLATLLMWLGPINVVLGLFNLVPGFPLDGGRILRAVLWAVTGDHLRATRFASRIGQVFAWLLIAAGLVMMLGLRLPFFGGGWFSGLWLAFIGWFLNNAALMSYRQLVVREALENVPVARIMQKRFQSVSPDMPIATLVADHVMASGQRSFPVEQDDRFVGLVCLQDLQRHPRESWDKGTVGQIMTRAEAMTSLSPEQDAAEAMTVLARRDVNQLPVLDGARLVGLLRREDVLKWLSIHQAGRTHGGRAQPAI